MRDMKIFITNLPSFYKINLYNCINEKCKLLVIYTGLDGDDRNADFFRGEMSFEHVFLEGNTWNKIRQALALLRKYDYEELFLSGWDAAVMWAMAAFSPKRKNSVVIESSLKESTVSGIKGYAKKLFCRRIAKGYVSGKPHAALLKALNFKGEIVVTRGVGVFNCIPQPAYVPRSEVKNFIYVGRLVAVKNLKFLIQVFNNLPDLHLTVVGFGEEELALRAMARENITFTGPVDNKRLAEVYQRHDVFILPSKSEPWGLVVEEALNNGLPVIVSNRVGCGDDVVTEANGLVFQWNDPESLVRTIRKMQDVAFYNSLRRNIAGMDFERIEYDQVRCYLK